MAVNGMLITETSAEANKNLLPLFCNFNDILHSWNTVSGGANSVVETTLDKSFFEKGSILMTFTDVGEHVFNCGGTEMDFEADQTTTHPLSYRLFCNNPSLTVIFTIEVLVDSVPNSNRTITQTLTTANGFVFNQWNTYYWNIDLTLGEVINYNFKVESDNISGTKLWFSGMKLEANDKGLTFPSLYTIVQPIETITTTTVDLPNIANNDTHTEAITIIGVKVGDFVEVVPPITLVTNQLICSAYATDTNEITLAVHNSSGSAVDLGSSSFKFKATRY